MVPRDSPAGLGHVTAIAASRSVADVCHCRSSCREGGGAMVAGTKNETRPEDGGSATLARR